MMTLFSVHFVINRFVHYLHNTCIVLLTRTRISRDSKKVFLDLERCFFSNFISRPLHLHVDASVILHCMDSRSADTDSSNER